MSSKIYKISQFYVFMIRQDLNIMVYMLYLLEICNKEFLW